MAESPQPEFTSEDELLSAPRRTDYDNGIYQLNYPGGSVVLFFPNGDRIIDGAHYVHSSGVMTELPPVEAFQVEWK